MAFNTLKEILTKNMKLSKLLLFIFFIFFLILAPYLILKSQGLIFDFKTFSFKKSGAIFLKIKPEPDLIKLDQKIINKKNNWPNALYFLNEGIFISQLKPKKYQLILEKANYYPWQKNFEVKENIVTSFNPLILIEKTINFKEQDLKIDENLNKIYLIDNQIIDKIIKGDQIVYFQENPNIYISFDSKKKIFYLYDLNNNQLVNLNELFKNLKKQDIYKNQKIEEKEENFLFFYPHPFLKNYLIIQTNLAFYNFALNNSKLELLFFNQSSNKAKILNKNIYVFNENNELVNYQFLLNTKTFEKIFLEKPEKIEFNNFNNEFYFLDQKNNLYQLNKNQQLELLQTNVKDFYFSNNNSYILILLKDNKIKIISLIQKKNWDFNFNFQNIKKIKFTPINEYFFASTEKSVYLCELYEGEENNCYLIKEKIKDFDLKENKIFILTEENKILEFEFENLK